MMAEILTANPVAALLLLVGLWITLAAATDVTRVVFGPTCRQDDTVGPREGQIATVQLQAGDQLVIYLNGSLSLEGCERLRDSLQQHLPLGTRVLVLEEGAKLGVLRAEQDELAAVPGRPSEGESRGEGG